MTHSTPLPSAERIQVLDIIRGIALCGILILNIYYFGRPVEATLNLNAFHETGQGNIISWYITMFLVEGSYRALFSILFGAGCILLISRLEKKDKSILPADIYYTRLIWLLVFGLINAFVLLWIGDILYSYAICGLLIFPFRNSSIRVLLVMMVFFISCTIFSSWLDEDKKITMKQKADVAFALQEQKKTLTEQQTADIKELKDYMDKKDPNTIRKSSDKEIIAFQKKSYPEVFKHVLPMSQEMETSVFYHFFFYDVMVFMFFGMALYKMGVLTGESPVWVYSIFVGAGYTLGIGSGILEGNAWFAADFDFFKYIKIRPFPFDVYQLHRVMVALGHIGTIMLLWKSGLFKWFLKPFASLGQMAFTNYLMQSVICTFFFNGYGFGYFGKLERYELWYVVVSVWIFQLIFSEIWLRYFLFGPLEWVWRGLTYWKVQKMKR